MSTFHVVVSDHLHAAGWELLEKAQDVSYSGPYECRDDVLKALSQADALIIRSTTVVDRELLEAAPQLKVVARAGARLGNVDLDASTRRGVMVINVPDASLTAIAEHTFAMLLAMARSIPEGYMALRAGEWPRHDMLGFQLCGKTLGIVGYGRLGREVAARARAFGMQVLAYDPYIDLASAREQLVEVVNFSELLARAEIVALLTELSPLTENLMDAPAFASMRPGAYFVNCAHACLVDEAALLQALDTGIIAGAALDTFRQEPPTADDPLIRHPRVIAAPHLNQNTVESQSITSSQVVEDVLAALRGEDYRHVVNLPFTETIPFQAVKPYVYLAIKLGKLQGQLAEGYIRRVEVELLGEGLRDLARPLAAVLLTGMLLPVNGQAPNWVSAPVMAYEQGIVTAQAKQLIRITDYPNLIACRIYWEKPEGGFGHRTVAGVLFANGEARLVQYDEFSVDAYPEGYVLVLENDDIPGVIAKISARLGREQINIAQWRYGREAHGGRAVSFINLDSRVPKSILAEFENEPEIQHARLVRL
ncbi:MAG: phosphoglycerate dehydrogenase [Chloroflexota bacterium]|nr:MAG: phosphoglycerate dehydrogenase [Chloroflexota bacterium]